jgi:hypothetical protein
MDKIMWFFFCSVLMWWIMLTDFEMLKQPCICGINPSWNFTQWIYLLIYIHIYIYVWWYWSSNSGPWAW